MALPEQRTACRSSPQCPHEPIALAPAMIEAVHRAHIFAPAATPVVLHGETGTGKTNLAEYIHWLSKRLDGFHPFGLGVEPPELALDALFGHVKGAYTDARSDRIGEIASAGTGTLLLDDMQNVELRVQKRLLQVVDRGTYRPTGSDRVQTVACRIILAMTEDPDVLMQRGELLKDLRYRYGSCDIRIAPLRERPEEIPLLAQWALERCPAWSKVDGPGCFNEETMELLRAAQYPGNVRELEGIVLHGFLEARAAGVAEIRAVHLPRKFGTSLRYQPHGDRAINKLMVERALQMTRGNVKAAAEKLGVSRTTVNAVRSSTAHCSG